MINCAYDVHVSLFSLKVRRLYVWMILCFQYSHHRNIATYYGAFIKKMPAGKDDQLWVSGWC